MEVSVGQPLTLRRLHLSYMWEGCVKIAVAVSSER